MGQSSTHLFNHKKNLLKYFVFTFVEVFNTLQDCHNEKIFCDSKIYQNDLSGKIIIYKKIPYFGYFFANIAT